MMNFSELRFVMCYSNYMNVSKSYSKIKKKQERIQKREGRRKEEKRKRKKEIPRYSGNSLQLTNQGI